MRDITFCFRSWRIFAGNHFLKVGPGVPSQTFGACVRDRAQHPGFWVNACPSWTKPLGKINQMEREPRTYSGQMLTNVGICYGKNSLQYMQAGGKVRKTTKPRAAAPSAAAAGPMTTAATLLSVSPEPAVTHGKGFAGAMN